MTVSRRRMLQGGAAVVGGAGLGWSGGAAAALVGERSSAGAATPAAPVRVAPPPGAEVVPFHGAHQAGVATEPQAFAVFLGLDLRAASEDPGAAREQLVRLLRLLTDDAVRLTAGRPALGDTEPELAVLPARLTVTIGLGPRVLTELTRTRVPLRPLPAFSIDRLEDRWGQTDLLIQLGCDDPLTLAHARRMLLKDAAAFARLRWAQEGFRRARGTEAPGTTMRNVLGQVDGTANPNPADGDFADLLWATAQDPGGPAFAGGTFCVLRRIRAELVTWDAVGRAGKEFAVGRRLDTGAPLTGERETDPLDLAAVDALGLPVIDAGAHVRRARSDDPRQRFLRRPYNYVTSDPSAPDGQEAGLLFAAYARDVERQFVPIQQRLAELDRLNQWVTPVGSAVYAIPPGLAAPSSDPGAAASDPTVDFLGRTLFA